MILHLFGFIIGWMLIILAGLVLVVVIRAVADALPWTTTCTNCWRWTTKTDYCPSCNYSTLK